MRESGLHEFLLGLLGLSRLRWLERIGRRCASSSSLRRLRPWRWVPGACNSTAVCGGRFWPVAPLCLGLTPSGRLRCISVWVVRERNRYTHIHWHSSFNRPPRIQRRVVIWGWGGVELVGLTNAPTWLQMSSKRSLVSSSSASRTATEGPPYVSDG